MAAFSPSYGLILFVMKGVSPSSVKMGDIYRAVVPIIFLDMLVMAIMIAFPEVVMWLPNMMIR